MLASIRFHASECVDVFAEPETIRGKITTDHSASCYGLPIFLSDDGTVYGPGDLPGAEIMPDVIPYTDEYRAWLRREEDAADDVSLGIPWEPSKAPSPKYIPEDEAILLACKMAGWSVPLLPD